jgi:NADH-quinone oxidoreductase subunit G
VRLLEPANAEQSERRGGTENADGNGVPDRFVRRDGSWRLVPLHHAFGSEELSILSPGVAELAPPAYVALGAEDAAGIGAAAGDVVVVELPGGSSELPLRVLEGLPRGVAGVPRGIAGVSPAPLPDFAVLRKVAP